MSEYFSEEFSGDDWAESGSFVLSERLWKEYLEGIDRQIASCLVYYLKLRKDSAWMTKVSEAMCWEVAPSDPFTAEVELFDTSNESSFDADENEVPKAVVYTPHTHPVYVSTKALYFYINRYFEVLLEREDLPFSALQVNRFSRFLKEGEQEALLGVHCLEAADPNLAVCHFKRALSVLNKTLGMLSEITLESKDNAATFCCNAQNTLFDLREIWLNLMDGCRR